MVIIHVKTEAFVIKKTFLPFYAHSSNIFNLMNKIQRLQIIIIAKFYIPIIFSIIYCL